VKPKIQPKAEASREDFADGSAILTFPGGSQLIIESDLAKVRPAGERRPVSYKKSSRAKRHPPSHS
jgi:hypothetical protein